MSTTKEGSLWKHPDEFLKLQRLRQRKKQLAARLNGNQRLREVTEVDKTSLLEAKIVQKRKNPFCKNTNEITNSKRPKIDQGSIEDDSLLSFIEAVPTRETIVRETPTRPPPAKLVLQPFDAQSFSKLLQDRSSSSGNVNNDEEQLEQQKFSKHLPMDWSLKTRLRLFCRSDLPATTLKTNQMASGLTSFVRCIDTQQGTDNSSLDISPATRFNQATYLWQHPHLPWITMFPRNSKDNNGIVLGDRERKALADDWDYSFRGLFQLLRSRQCPYFYLCANTFTVLFRAAGTGGLVETHALMTPSTRGMRSALRQEGIEYTMPLKKDNPLNRSADSAFSEESNSVGVAENVGKVAESAGDRTAMNPSKPEDGSDSDNEVEEDEWLQSLGVDEKEIRKIQTAHIRKIKSQEMSDDFSDNSVLLFEGVECQGFFSFLLNAKSTITSVGRLAGVPPTLLAPVGFPKATMQHLNTRSNKVRLDGVDYCSIEVKGIIMPTFLPYVCQLLGETKDVFSATMATNTGTLAFSKATQKLLAEPKPAYGAAETSVVDETAGQVFGQENLSDCGLLSGVLESICRTGQNAVALLERVCYDEAHGYAWS